MQSVNRWVLPRSTVEFIEKALSGHNNVDSFANNDNNLYIIYRKNNNIPLRVVFVNEYTLGISSVLELCNDFKNVDCIVTSSAWNAYTQEAKKHGLDNHIGIFIINEFLGSLWLKQPYKYVQKDKDGNPIYHYRSA